MMRHPRSRSTRAVLLTSFLLPSLALAVGSIDCSHIQTEKVKWDLSKLGGPHSVMQSSFQSPSWANTTYTIDICRPLERPGNREDKEDFCPGGTRVCAIQHTGHGDQDVISSVTPVAGDLQNYGGKALDATFERLKSGSSHADTEKEGVRIIMNGGYSSDKRPQRAIVEFLCNKDRTGEEGNIKSDYDKLTKRALHKRADEEKEGDGENENDGEEATNSASLTFKSYGPDPDNKIDILRLEWQTKYACEEQDEDEIAGQSWGFFTWFILLAFLGTAAYLVFGSWLNYNRYGARGWDLLPHGDTIRDVPYLLKDWTRKALSTVQSGGARGGYSAV